MKQIRIGDQILAGAVVAASLSGCSAFGEGANLAQSDAGISIEALSTHADRMSGGDLLVRVTTPDAEMVEGIGSASDLPTLLVDGRAISVEFSPDGPGRFIGLATGLPLGVSELSVPGDSWGVSDATLGVTNYPTTGPIVSGPHIEPFICQTASFELPDGSLLGTALDADCTVPTLVQHVYRSTEEEEFRLLPDDGELPADLAVTTTLDGMEVPFIVRLETGSMNRGIYQNAVLHNPRTDPPPTPFSPPPAWNRHLIAVHGSGCTGGWYRQGSAMGVNPVGGVRVTRLAEGYAVFTNTLNHPSNSCNPILAAESTMMGKEHFIETFGVPDFTVSIGGSGGAYTGLQVADAFPGLIDGVIATSTFPDALSIAVAGLDGRLLTNYFASLDPTRLTEEQRVAVSGYSGIRALEDAANQSARVDPVPDREDLERYRPARWNDVIPEELRYDPRSRPDGARPTVFDWARNMYGVDPSTGSALWPYDNGGVQYGLAALNAGTITMDDFLDLNERIGGVDRDANYTAERSVADPGALERTYRGGVTLGGGGGLASIPVLDAGRYNDVSGYHYQWFHFAVRERMRAANGRADNHLLWRGSTPADESWGLMVDWLTAIASDPMDDHGIERVMRNRPDRAVDGCWIEDGEGREARFVAEPQTFSSAPTTTCNERFPSYGFTRLAAGGPLDGNVLKCQLKAVDPADYATPPSEAEMARLSAIFPEGVCDWSVPGVEQAPVVTWPSFGPAPENLVFDVSEVGSR